MEQVNYTTRRGKYKHLNERDRYRLEGYLETGLTVKQIAQKLNSHLSTIYREIKRGQVKRIHSDLTEYWAYRANTAHSDYERKVTNRAHSLKIEKYEELATYIQKKIHKHKYSPDAVIGELNRTGQGLICTKTLYNYIDRGVFEGVTNYTLWEKRKRHKHKYRQVSRVSLKNKGSRSIEERPERINNRLEYGHWEGDSIVGLRNGKKDALFTLSERMTREEIIIKIKSMTQDSILNAINKLETSYGSYFREKFKSITLDNGREFLDWESIEQSRLNGKKRTLVYFAHPYSSWERGTNENQNRMIRRFIPKGTDISKLSDKDIKRIEGWMNNYPRKILGYKTPNELVLNVTNSRSGVLN
ncbi:MAG: IS30 family transposase [Candidatus Omnitrophica bacterium]|nr:IS30 family transposase [Candidatus Omnitrophota bacterium]